MPSAKGTNTANATDLGGVTIGDDSGAGLVLGSWRFINATVFQVSPDGARLILSDRTRTEDDELGAYENLLLYVKSAP